VLELTHEIKTAFHNLDETQFAEEIGKFARALQELHESQWGILGKKCLKPFKMSLIKWIAIGILVDVGQCQILSNILNKQEALSYLNIFVNFFIQFNSLY
jgi:hypothetical protein